ncbi:alcohol dehydrogenase family protein [Paraburkholderia sp. EG304]|uniref:alcohol dehydrogenase family protein n=1 Tax=Paraburkholderia sp. EG304 TaxID=3237015 RepID=UPI00397B9878
MNSAVSESAIPDAMRAVLLTGYGGIDKLQYREDVPVPRPKKGEVLIKVGACGINNTDINLRTQWYNRAAGATLTEEVGLRGVQGIADKQEEAAATWKQEANVFPRIQGAAIAGRIVAVGDAANAARVGERVIVDPQVRDLSLPERAQLVEYIGGERDGGFAEYVAVPAENAYAVTSSLSDAELATFPTSYDTAEEMLERARLSEGETVVVTGASGGVGTALVQLALIRKARVIAIAGESKEDRVRALGVHAFIPRESESIKAAVERIVGANSVDVVADVVGGQAFGDFLKVLRRGGRYTTGGAIGGPIQPMDLRDLIYKDLEMYGITCPTPATFARVIAHVSSGKLRPLLDKAYPLDQLAQAQTDFVKRTHVGKFVIEPTTR